MTEKKKGHFELSQKTTFDDVVNGKVKQLPESDLCFQNDDTILQFKYIEPEHGDRRYVIKPGTYTLTETNSGVKIVKSKLEHRELLATIDNTSAILNEAETFFKKLHVYERLQRQKKRGVLLYSKPGMGKSAGITKICEHLTDENPGAVVLNWPTSELDAEQVARFLSLKSRCDESCTKMILIIEDIGGAEHENRGCNGVDSGLLNLLDGINVTFTVPTFIIATTNYPENLLSALADRPGRFDLMLELKSPKYDEKVALMEFIAKRKITKEEKEALKTKGCEQFSIAHLEEIVIRSELHDKTIPAVVAELIEHSKHFKNFFQDTRKLGIHNS